MLVKDIITPELILCDVNVSSKKRLLELASEILSESEPELNPQDIFESFIMREKLGSTAIGYGVALPHSRLKQTEKTIGTFILLDEGVDFDADDGTPVDLVFAMLVPEQSTEEHLKLLAQLAEMFSKEEFRTALRETHDTQSLYELIIERSSS